MHKTYNRLIKINENIFYDVPTYFARIIFTVHKFISTFEPSQLQIIRLNKHKIFKSTYKQIILTLYHSVVSFVLHRLLFIVLKIVTNRSCFCLNKNSSNQQNLSHYIN